MKYLIIIILVILFGTWIYYINWRSSIIGNLKSKVFYKRKKLKPRTISNKVVKENFSYLKREFEMRNIKLQKEKIQIPERLKKKLKYSDYRQKEMEQLLAILFEFMDIKDKVPLEVNYYSSRKRPPYAGLYYDKEKRISLYINLRDDTFESVLSTLIHESTHHFLMSKGIIKKDRKENEILTDLCTVYLGLGKQMYEGYKLRSKILYIDERYKYQNTNKVGYINPGDIKYAMKIRKKYI